MIKIAQIFSVKTLLTVALTLSLFAGTLSLGNSIAHADSNASSEPNGLQGLSPDEVSIVRRVEGYLNDLKSVSARFIQISSNGSLSEGKVNIQRPGQMRFEYDPPVPIVMVANGATLLYFDKKLKQSTYLPLWKTPLWFLIREKVELHKDIQILRAQESDSTIQLELKAEGESDGTQMTLLFSDNPISLKKWEVVDAQGITTQVSLINPVYDTKIDEAIFKTDDLDLKRQNPEK
ncbi:outer membrane lipoprotein carrier protein LolA [Kiloniella sp. EL199]|uniref:LolA family protein n=1 Tax=Kiloniella sp. EL199 TaxID=2107581 RepID=UPI0013C43069|nr:outer membrane lipoprotein carrier protein LolA [Kiloniella sp. EL199]